MIARRLGSTSRRSLLVGMGLAGVGIVLPAAAQQEGTPATLTEGSAEMPAWTFTLHALQDPYAGAMQAPVEAQPGTRYVAAEVELRNDSDQALNFTPIDIRIRDAAGVEYRGGGAIGAEPMINPRNLNPGELSRGWVWFTLPEGASAIELVYVGPQPQFRIPLTG